jgi:hypothetical protein
MLKLDFNEAFSSTAAPRGLMSKCDVCHNFHPQSRITGRRSVGFCCYICDWFLSGLRREVWTIQSKKYGAPK